MRSRFGLLLAGTLTLLVTLVIFFPARVAYQWFAPPGAQLSGLSGSIWYGQANEASTGGFYLRNLRWRVKPLTLLTGKLGYAIEASPVSGIIAATVAIGFGNSILITDMTGSLPLQSLQGLLGIPGLRGDLSAEFDRLQLRDGFPVAADGFVEIAKLAVPAIYHSSIGGYRADFFTQDSGVAASVEDTDGVVDIAGSLRVTADRSYRFIAQLAAKSAAPASVRQQLQFLGSANERGQHELRLEGRF